MPVLGGGFDGTVVALHWEPAVDPESGIQSYYLYRDGMLLAEQLGTTLSYADPGFVHGATHVYEQRAMNWALLLSPPSVLPVTLPPPVEIFADGFESGDLSAWSSTEP